jgi:7,8-didemethyl-8-hydroxy-5-deazariboflavin synthase CofH subunit
MKNFSNLSIGKASLDELLGACQPAVARTLEKALVGEELDFSDGRLLCDVNGPDLIALVKTADELRRRVVGETVTYVFNRNINFTNICKVGCAFCGFGRGPRAPGAYRLSLDEIVEKAAQARQLGATEVCIQSGLPPDLDGFFYRDILRSIKALSPGLHIHAFSPMEIDYGVEKTCLPLVEYLSMLKESGLDTIPGTAAEILDDEIRETLSPNKLKAHRWVEIVRTAHRLGIPTTSTMMYGHVERPEHWVRHLLLLRQIQKETGGITEFVPLAFIYEKTRLYRRGSSRPGSTFREDLIVHALARVLLNGWIRNIQVSWVKLGFAVSLACLQAGANDFGGTLMEENISKSAGTTFGDNVAPEEFRRLIRITGRIPAERNTTYGLLHVFQDEDEPLSIARPLIRPQKPKQAYWGAGY